MGLDDRLENATGTSSAKVAMSLVRLWARELCVWLDRHLSLARELREPTRDVILRVVEANQLESPMGELNLGGADRSARGLGAMMLLGLVQLLLGVDLHAGVAVLGDVTLSGRVVSSSRGRGGGGVVAAIRAAVESGVARVVVPREDEEELARHLGHALLADVLFADDVLDLFQHTVVGECSVERGVGSEGLAWARPSSDVVRLVEPSLNP